ncbi:MAG: ParB/Srx family N-terminal domain-containing protein [Acutalibacteraceae bacterium]
MKIVKIKLSELKRPEKNVRMHSDKQIEEFKRSVKMFGQIRPIVVDENNVMLAGNGLYETLVALEYTEADCYVVKGLSENEKKKLMLADNRIFNLGVDDLAAFDEIIKELAGDFDIPGYDDDLLQTLIADSEDVDEMMSDYGTLTEEKKEEIKSNAVIYEDDNAERGSTEPIRAVEHNSDEPSSSDNDANYIICPHCGEKIWL